MVSVAHILSAVVNKVYDSAILDFFVPHGLQFSISKAPNKMFATTYSMNALPSLKGSVGYTFSSCKLDLKSSHDVLLEDVVNPFKIHDQYQKPEFKHIERQSVEKFNGGGEDILKYPLNSRKCKRIIRRLFDIWPDAYTLQSIGCILLGAINTDNSSVRVYDYR